MAALPKVVVILGPTGSGKTALSLVLAKKFNGEVISADSRQFYRKMSVATAKPQGEWGEGSGGPTYMVEGVPHYLMDFIDPGKQMSMAEFKELAFHYIADITRRGKVPFVVGGTGLYIWAIVDNLDMPHVPPNKKLRQSLEKKPLAELVLWLEKLDPEALEVVDIKNPRRVIRALEVTILSGEGYHTQRGREAPVVEALQLGVRRELSELYGRIDANIAAQFAGGIVGETESLLRQHYSFDLPSMSSIGYRQIAEYLAGACTLEAVMAEMQKLTHQYAKRQLTWFKRDIRIQWIRSEDEAAVEALIAQFLG